jgi:hypothetical protein
LMVPHNPLVLGSSPSGPTKKLKQNQTITPISTIH